MRARTVLALAFLVALFLRWPIASHDVEHYVGPDEGEVVENVLEMLRTGDFDHRHPGYPGLHFYIQMVPLAGHLFLEGHPLAELPREGFYLGARRTTLLAGLLTAALVLAIGRSHFSPPVGALAVSLLLASPLVFRESAVVNPDLMLSLFVTAALLSALRLLERQTWTRFLVAGASVGLAAAVKYTGGLTVVSYALAFLLGPRPRGSGSKALTGLGAAALAFALASPYTILDPGELVRGLAMHVGYYRASDMNAALELLRVVATRGLGVVAALGAGLGVARAFGSRAPRNLVTAAFPLLYLLIFSFFDRAFPRHALPILPALALLAGDGAAWIAGRWRRPTLAWAALALAMLAGPVLGSLELFRRSLLPTPADRLSAWASAELPGGSRILEDQYTPRLDAGRFRVHRLRVEEEIFVGNFDWVFASGYPPGIVTEGLREVRRFETEDSLGDTILVYQVPPRASLMPVTLPRERAEVEIGAGELPYFGEGFHPPAAGAFGTERLSAGPRSEIYFVLPSTPEPSDLDLELTLAAAIEGFAAEVEVRLNGGPAGTVEVWGAHPGTYSLNLSRGLLSGGLNRLSLRYAATVRRDRRHPDTAVRFFRLRLSRR